MALILEYYFTDNSNSGYRVVYDKWELLANQLPVLEAVSQSAFSIGSCQPISFQHWELLTNQLSALGALIQSASSTEYINLNISNCRSQLYQLFDISHTHQISLRYVLLYIVKPDSRTYRPLQNMTEYHAVPYFIFYQTITVTSGVVEHI